MLNHDPVEKHLNMAWRTSLRAGFIASGLLLFFYSLVVWLSSGSVEHLLDLVREDGAYVAAITTGFGVQIALFSYLKRGMHHVSRSASVVGASGAGTSTLAMVACCLHHVTDIAPLVGLTGTALFLNEYKRDLMTFGLVMMVLGIVWMMGLIVYHRRRGHLVPVTGIQTEGCHRQ
jgi:hypothetical protein